MLSISINKDTIATTCTTDSQSTDDSHNCWRNTADQTKLKTIFHRLKDLAKSPHRIY